VTSSSPGAVTIFSLEDGKLVGGTSSQLNKDWALINLAFSPNGNYIGAVNNWGSVVMYGVAHGTPTGGISYPIPSSQWPNSLAFSPDGTYLATANGGSNNVTLFTVSEGTLSQAITYSLPSNSSAPTAIAFSPNGLYLATANSGSKDITIFKVLETGTLGNGTSYTAANLKQFGQVVFSSDGNFIISTDGLSNNVIVFPLSDGEVGTGTLYDMPSGTNTTSGVAVSPDGQYAAINAFYSRQVVLIDTSCLGIGIPTSSPQPTILSSTLMSGITSQGSSTGTVASTTQTSLITSDTTSTTQLPTANIETHSVTSQSTESATTMLTASTSSTARNTVITASSLMAEATSLSTSQLTGSAHPTSTGMQYVSACKSPCIVGIITGGFLVTFAASLLCIIAMKNYQRENIFGKLNCASPSDYLPTVDELTPSSSRTASANSVNYEPV
jgi:6-phosphogluconolactonase (cycloisomerase 2 family)